MGKRWKPEDDKVLLDNYANGMSCLLELFPGRTKDSIYQRKFALAHAPITFNSDHGPCATSPEVQEGNALPQGKEAPQPWTTDR